MEADDGEELRFADRIAVAVLSTGQVLVHDQQKTGSSSQSAPAIVHLGNVWQLETVNRQLLAELARRLSYCRVVQWRPSQEPGAW